MTHSTDLATRNGGAMLPANTSAYRPLDHLSGGRRAEDIRVDTLATISAGYRAQSSGDRPGMPQRTQDGTIYVHGDLDRVPNLRETLAAREGKTLTITFPSDDESEIVQEFFARYSATKLEAYADLVKAVEIKGEQRFTYQKADQPQKYAEVVATCKAYHRILFYLMVWAGDHPETDLSDGFAPYAIRTTGRHSMNSLLSAIRETKRYTGGRIAGIPFECWIDPKREVTDGKGVKQRIPVWRFATRAPNGIRLPPAIWQKVANKGLEQGSLLVLGSGPTFEEAEMVAPDDAEIQYIEKGGRCDPQRWREVWFALVRDTALEGDDERHAFLERYTDGQYSSLSAWLAVSTDAEAADLIAAVMAELGTVAEVVDERPLANLTCPECGRTHRLMETPTFCPSCGFRLLPEYREFTDEEVTAKAAQAREIFGTDEDDNPTRPVEPEREEVVEDAAVLTMSHDQTKALRVAGQGHEFTCEACKQDWGAMKTKTGVLPVWDWFELLFTKGIHAPLCNACVLVRQKGAGSAAAA